MKFYLNELTHFGGSFYAKGESQLFFFCEKKPLNSLVEKFHSLGKNGGLFLQTLHFFATVMYYFQNIICGKKLLQKLEQSNFSFV